MSKFTEDICLLSLLAGGNNRSQCNNGPKSEIITHKINNGPESEIITHKINN